MTFIKRLMEIKEEQLKSEELRYHMLRRMEWQLGDIIEILKVLKGRKDGKRKISRKN